MPILSTFAIPVMLQAKIHDEMTIYAPNGTVCFEVPLTKDATIKRVLMGDYYIELPFNLDRLQPFARGSYVLYQGRKFEIMSTVRPEFDTKTGGYKYTLRFEAQQNHMKRRKVFWLKSSNAETCFHDTATLADFGTLIVDNMNRFFGNSNWKMAAVPDDLASTTKLVSFNADFCWDALCTIAETFEVEWWTVENGNEVWLYFGKLEFGTPERFERGKVVTSIPAKQGDNSSYGTRFYIFGSTRNLPEDYNRTEQGGVTSHVSEVRLHLPNGLQYIDAWDDLAPEDIIEQVAFFEDVFPKNSEIVTGTETIKRKVENSEDKDRTFDAYVMYCKDTPFVPSDVYPGETLRCRFTSGSLNGREFDLAVIKDDTGHTVINPENWKPDDGFNKKFEIIADVETYGEDGLVIIPNDSLHPEPGDTFVLTGVKLPKERIDEAEQELLKLGKEWARKNSSDTDIYDCPTNPVYCHRNDKNYELGQKVLLIDERFGKDGRISRIQGFEKKLWHEYEATYTVGDNSSYSRLGSIETSISESAYAERIGVVSGVGIYLIRSKYDTTAPTDYNAYSAAAVEAFFLNKIKGGTISAPVSFKKNIIAEDGIVSKDFKEGYFAGAGFRLGKDVNGASVLEVDNAIIRKKAVFNEVVINQISFTIGETVFSNGGCECTTVEERDDCYRCFYDNKDGRRYSGLAVGDQVRCQRYDPTQHTIIKYYWRLVVGAGKNYIDLSKTDCDGTDIPEEGDNLVQFGHRTDVSRQSAIVIDPLNGGSIEAFAGIDSYTLSEKNRIGMGTNPITGESYLYGYGNLYLGDRDMTDPNSTWLTFQQKEGSDRKKLYIKGNIEMGPDTTGLQNVEEFKQVLASVSVATNAADAAAKAAEKINDLEIGGTNLMDNSTLIRQPTNWRINNTPTTFEHFQGYDCMLTSNKGAGVYGNIHDDEFEDGEIITFSVWAYSTVENADIWLGYEFGDIWPFVKIPEANKWVRISHSLQIPQKEGNISSMPRNCVVYNMTNNAIIAFRNVKAERGNIATTWSLSLADQQVISGLQFIKRIFPDGLINNAATVSQLLAVKDSTAANANVVAGIYGGGVEELEKNGFKDTEHGKLMIFAGAENIDKVSQANTRIYEDGAIVTNKLIANKAQIENSTLTNVTVEGTIRSPFQPFDGSIVIEIQSLSSNNGVDYNNFDNISCGNTSSGWELGNFDHLKWDPSQNGRTLTFVNYRCKQQATYGDIRLTAPSGYSFFENGTKDSVLSIHKGELVQLKGYGEEYNVGNSTISVFYGWIVLSRTKMPGYVEPQTGFQLKPRRINQSGTISSTDNVLFVTANVTLTLPSDPEDGQMLFMKNIAQSARTTVMPGSAGHYINDGKYNKRTSWSWDSGQIIMLIWDAANKTWQAAYTNCN